MKHRLWTLLAAALVWTALAAPAMAEEVSSGDCGENVRWSMDSDGTLTISGSGPMQEYGEEKDDGYWLYSPPFWNWDSSLSKEKNQQGILRIVVEDGVTTVGAGAFRDLSNLASVELPDSVTSIGNFAFQHDALTEVVIPKNVVSIGSDAFNSNTALAAVTLPDSLESIGDWAFYSTALTEITIPKNVTDIGDRVFYDCTDLQNIHVDGDNPAFKDVDGVLLTKDGTELRAYCPGRSAASYQVPDGVRVIYPSAFSYSDELEEVLLPNGLEEIRNWAFGHTGLKSVVLPRGVKTVQYCAFGGCAQLAEATLPLSLTVIEDWTFGDCPLTDVYYEGTEAQWNAIDIQGENDELMELISAGTIHFGSGYCAHEKLTYHPAVPHTCTEDGSIAYWQCDNCGLLFLDEAAKEGVTDVTVPAAHTYVSEVTLQPGCVEPGVRTYTCVICVPGTEGHSYTEEIPATGHSYRSEITLAPTCSETGVVSLTCTVCEPGTEGHTDTREIPATGAHRFEDHQCVNLLRDGVTVCGAAEYRDRGACGESAEWILESNGTLRITGEGDMAEYGSSFGADGYSYSVNSPWFGYRNLITRIVVESGVTSVGRWAFCGLTSVKRVDLPASVTTVGAMAFLFDAAITDVYYAGTSEQWASIVFSLGNITSFANPGNMNYVINVVNYIGRAEKHYGASPDDGASAGFRLMDPVREGSTVTVAVTADAPAAVWCALYEEDGRFLSAESVDVAAGRSIPLSFPAAGAARCQILAVGTVGLTPLCAAVEGDI